MPNVYRVAIGKTLKVYVALNLYFLLVSFNIVLTGNFVILLSFIAFAVKCHIGLISIVHIMACFHLHASKRKLRHLPACIGFLYTEVITRRNLI